MKTDNSNAYHPYVQLTSTNNSPKYAPTETNTGCVAAKQLTVTNITANSVTITWQQEGDANTWTIKYKKTGDETDITEGVSGESKTVLSNLEPNTSYSAYVVTECGENSPNSDTCTFTTDCEAKVLTDENPYKEDFDSYTDGSITFPNCWTNVLDLSTNDLLHNTLVNTGKKDNGLAIKIMKNKEASIVATPTFTNELTDLRVTFYRKAEGTSAGTFDFGYINNVSDPSTFVVLQTYQPTDDNWHLEKIDLDTYSETLASTSNVSFAFRHNQINTSFSYWILDSVVVEKKPDCAEPTNVTVTSITHNSAKLTWSSNANSYNINLVAEGQTIAPITDIEEQKYQLSNLTPATTYTATIIGVCDGGTLTNPTTITFTTHCSPIAISKTSPYSELFNDYAINDSVFPNCWTNVLDPSTESSHKNKVTKQGKEGKGFKINIAEDKPVSIVAMPQFENSLTDLRVQFYKKAENTDETGTLDFGYISNMDDTSTFVVLKSYLPKDADWHLEKIDLDNYTDKLSSVNNAYLAFRHSGTSSYYNYWALDSVVVKMKPDCVEPTNVKAEEITATSMKITWSSNAPKFELDVVSNGQILQQLTDIIGNEYQLSNLTPATTYKITVTGVCADGKSTESTEIEVSTSCQTLTANDLPKIWNFESNNNGGTLTNPLPTCWNRLNNQTQPTVKKSTYTAYQDSCYLSCEDDAANSIVVLQEVNTSDIAMNKLQISLYAKNGNKDATGLLEIGVVSDPTDKETFVVVDTMKVIGNVYALYETSLDSYTGTGSYPAIRFQPDATKSTFMYVDNITLEKIPACAKVKDVTIETMETSAKVTINDAVEGLSYKVYYKAINETTWNETSPVNSNVITITGLISSTTYNFYIGSICTNGDIVKSNPSDFKTACPAIVVTENSPWEETFSSEDALSCWTIEKTNTKWTLKNGALHHNYQTELGSSDIVSPIFDLSSVVSAKMVFKRTIPKYINKLDSLTVLYRASFSDAWTELYKDKNAVNDFNTITLPNLSDTYQIKFRFINGNGNGIDIDSVQIIATGSTVSCNKPTNLTTTDITTSSFTITWEGEANKYNVQLDESAPIPVNAKTYTFNNLQPSTTYSVKVQAICDDNSTSKWTSPLTVKTMEEQQSKEPVVTTGQANAEQTTATLNGTVNKGNATITKSGFKYRKVGENTWTNEVEAEITASGSIMKVITGLTSETNYEFAAFVLTSENKEYTGLAVAFKTKQSSLTDVANTISVVTYPNPTTHNATLKVEGLTTDAKVILTDVQGRVINTQTIAQGQNEVIINTEKLTSGVYYIKVIGEGINKTQSLIKK